MLSEAEKTKRAKEEKKRISLIQKAKDKQEKRKEQIVKHVREGKLTLKSIGLKFGVSKQRINQICVLNNISRWTEIRETSKMLFEKVMIDFKMGASIDEIVEKHNIDRSQLTNLHRRYAPEEIGLIEQYRIKRDKKIISDYSNGITAKRIIEKTDKVLGDPSKVNTVDGVYRIASKNGVKRYPQIGNRSAGGSFEKKSILKMIVKMYEHKKFPAPFHEIAGTLNELGYETICGKEFTPATVRIKYHAYKAELNGIK
jgi:hypothetical protein